MVATSEVLDSDSWCGGAEAEGAFRASEKLEVGMGWGDEKGI